MLLLLLTYASTFFHQFSGKRFQWIERFRDGFRVIDGGTGGRFGGQFGIRDAVDQTFGRKHFSRSERQG